MCDNQDNSFPINHQVLLTVQQLASLCGVSARTVTRWIEGDGLPVHQMPGRGGRSLRLIHRSDFDEWIRQYRLDTKVDVNDQPAIRINGRRFFPDADADGNGRGRGRRGA